MPYIDDSIFALDRSLEARVYINGLLVGSGFGAEGNVKSISVDFQIDQLPPTAALEMVTIPSWVKRGQDVWIDAGYDGNLRRIFTGHVKRRRHTPGGESVDVVGRTQILTRTYRMKPKSFVAQTASAAIADILNDLTPPFEPTSLDSTLDSLVIGSVKTAVLDVAPPSDMIRKIADIDGHRLFETPSGSLIIRPLLEAPGPSGFRFFSTTAGLAERTQDTTITYSDSNIDQNKALGDAAARTSRGQGFKATVSGRLAAVSFWVRKVGSPTDKLHMEVRADNGNGATGLPTSTVLGGAMDFPGSLLSGTYQKVTFLLPANQAGDSATRLDSGSFYHITLTRTGAVDAVNYYEVGADESAPSYADGQASVFNGSTWAAASPAADHAFEVVQRVYPKLRVLDIADDEDEDQVKKKVYVTGATLQTTDSEGNQVQTPVKAEAVTLDDSLAVGDPELFAMTYQNDLIDTTAKASAVALRLLDRFHRILENIEMSIPFDPLIALGTTINIDDPTITEKTGNWWIQAYRHSLTVNGAETSLSLFGGDQSGTSGFVAPQPEFTFVMERELIGNALQVVITFYDQSSDLDGSITNYTWQDTYAGGAMNISGPDKVVVTRAYDPAVDNTFDVTLTVTDDSGLTRSITKTISIDVSTGDNAVYAPLIAVAAGNTCMYTKDGAQSWIDRTTPSGVAKTVAVGLPTNALDPPVLLFGTDTGRVYRSVDDNASLTLVLDAGSAHPIVDIIEQPLIPTRFWALTSTGRVYKSDDRGATWSLYVNLTNPVVLRHENDPGGPGFINPTPCSRIIGSEPQVNRIWVMGGKGTDPATWFITNYLPDGPNIWRSEVVPGDGAAVSTGDANDTVVDSVVSHATSGDLGLVFKGRDTPYIYADPNYYDRPAAWVNGVGLTSMVDGRSAAGNNNQLQLFGLVNNSKDFFRSQDGFTWERLVGVLPGTAGNRPNELIGVSAWRDIFLCAMDEGVAKSIDYGTTWEFLRPKGAPWNTTWPVGAIGYQIDIEYRRPESHSLMALIRSVADNKTATVVRRQGSAWVKQSEDAAIIDTRQRLRRFSGMGNTAFRCRQSGDERTWRFLQRTTDLGVTWADTTVEDGSDIDRAPDGTLWALGSGGDNAPHRIYKSVDNGATWTEKYNDPNTTGGQFSPYNRIRVDPNDSNRIMAFGWSTNTTTQVIAVSLDGGEGWSRVTPTFTSQAEKTVLCLWAAQNERWIVAYEDFAANTVYIEKSDNNGSTWSLLKSYATTVNEPFQSPINAGLHILAVKAASGAVGNLVVRSRDNGATWETLPNPPGLLDQNALAYDPTVDTLYAGEDDGTNNTNVIVFMRSPSLSGVWQDLTENMATATGYSQNRVCDDGLIAIVN